MISFVYFDIGGVVIKDIVGPGWAKMKQDIGITDTNNQEFDQWFDEKEKLLCIGKENFDLNFRNIKLTLNDFVSRFGVNKSIWPIIKKIHQHCKIGLLTNMYPHMLEEIKKRDLLPEVVWDLIIDSSVEGIAKPDTEIFQLAEEKAKVKGEGVLFVDNSFKNIQAASDFGWQTFLYDSSDLEGSSRKLSELVSIMD